MKKIVLISNHVFHYRIKVYNFFFNEFIKKGYELILIASSIQKTGIDIVFKHYITSNKITKTISIIKKIKPDFIINFLHLKDIIIYPIYLYSKINRIPNIYWNHGVNNQDSDNKFKNMIYYLIHNISSAILLYSPNELRYVKKKNHKKTFIAYNTLNFSDINKDDTNGLEYVKIRYKIKENNLLAFIGRIKEIKALDILLDYPIDIEDVAVIIVGPGISQKQLEKVEKLDNYYYLGPIYESLKINEIFNSIKIFCTPGHIGLALNEAFFWGVPVIVLNRKHAPEIYYLEDKVNGYIVNTPEEIKEKIRFLLENKDIYDEMSKKCVETINTKGNINNMFGGFMKAINYCEKKKLNH